MIYQFTDGCYSDWCVGPPVSPPEGVEVDLPALKREWIAAVVPEGEDHYGDWRYDDEYLAKSCGDPVGVIPDPRFLNASDWFSVFLVRKKGWSALDSVRFNLGSNESSVWGAG